MIRLLVEIFFAESFRKHFFFLCDHADHTFSFYVENSAHFLFYKVFILQIAAYFFFSYFRSDTDPYEIL